MNVLPHIPHCFLLRVADTVLFSNPRFSLQIYFTYQHCSCELGVLTYVGATESLCLWAGSSVGRH